MNEDKNRAVLFHKGQSFIVYQDKNDKWVYSYGNMVDANTQSKDLQTALNLAYETINESTPSNSAGLKKSGRYGWI